MQIEHPSRTIVKMMQQAESTGIYPRLVLLFGKEDFLVEWSKHYLIDNIVNPATKALDLCIFSENDIELTSIITACDTPAMMSKQKLVIVDNSDLFTLSPKDMSSVDIQVLNDYLSNIPDDTTLVFTAEKVNKVKALYKTISKNGIVYDFTPLDDATLGSWMAKRFIAAGKQANKSDLVTFARSLGYGDEDRNYTLYNLENDLKMLFALYSDKTGLTLDDMLSAVDGQQEQNAFKLLDSAFSGNKDAALNILNANIDSKLPSQEMGVVLSFLGLLISQIEIMVEGKEREEEGQDYYSIVKSMGVNEFRYKKAMSSCRNKSARELRKVLDSAFQIEKDIKSGNINGRLALELFIGKL